MSEEVKTEEENNAASVADFVNIEDGKITINALDADGKPDKVVIILRNLPNDAFSMAVWAFATEETLPSIWSIYSMARGIMHLAQTDQEIIHAAFEDLSEQTQGKINEPD